MMRGGGAQTQTEEEIQANLFRGFARTFTGQAMNFRSMTRGMSARGSGINNVQRWMITMSQPTTDRDYSMFPQFYGFVDHIHSDKYPVFDMALENYLKNRTAMNFRGFRFFQGITDAEKANLRLAGRSLADILADPAESAVAPDVLNNKGNYLFAMISSGIGADKFATFLSDFLYERQFKDIDVGDLERTLDERFQVDIAPMLDAWYAHKGVPAYVITDVSCREVVDMDRTRYQVMFTIANTESVEGVVTASFMVGGGSGGRSGGQRGSSGGGSFMMQGTGSDANSRTIILAGGQTK